jgi:aryl-alcohol dehydrogenase-like predicted oxidoreductase
MATPLTTARLGRTELPVTRLGYGAMELRGPRIWSGRPVSDDDARAILNAVLDGGINLIDTANDYGRSEELIGRYVAHRRSEYYLVTKSGCQVTPGDGGSDATPHDWSRANLLRGLHESLARLRTDYVDIILLHNPTVQEAMAHDVVATLEEMRRSGWARWIGISTTEPQVGTFLDWGVFDVFELPYSALEREHEVWVSRAAEAGAGIIVRGGVARGEPGHGLGSGERWAGFAAAGLDELREPGESRTAFMLRYTLSHPGAHSVIVGTLDPLHLAEKIGRASCRERV